MVDQKEEAKKEKFIETMPTMIQTHLITFKDWAAVKDTAKSLEHIILKCDPPTPAMPMMATVPGLYSHIAIRWTKMRVKYPNHLKVLNLNKLEVEENLRIKDRTHQKPKRQMKLIHTKTLIIIIAMPQVRVEVADLTTVKVVTDNLKGSYNETEAKDLSIINDSFKIIAIREVHHNKTVLNTAVIVNPIFREIKQIALEAVVVDLSNSEDAVVEGPIIRIATECISITHMTHNQNNMAHPAVYAADLTILLSIATRENMT